MGEQLPKTLSKGEEYLYKSKGTFRLVNSQTFSKYTLLTKSLLNKRDGVRKSVVITTEIDSYGDCKLVAGRLSNQVNVVMLHVFVPKLSKCN